jgi:DNA-binding CsgD family transcriptional regulator
MSPLAAPPVQAGALIRTPVLSAVSDEPALIGRRHELDTLAALVEDARAGRSGVLIVRGEPGIGKSVLLDDVARRAHGFLIARVAGVESEMELPYAALQQLCRPFGGRVADLPAPQREALSAAFGLDAGPPRDRYLVGLAVLQLLAASADERPVLCIMDDAQWLDRASVQTIAFVARRLLAEPILFVVGAREPADDRDWAGLPELTLRGLDDADAAVLFDSVVTGPTDPRLRERIVAESRGNPLALLELPRSWTTAELVEGVGAPGAGRLTENMEDGFAQRLRSLPTDTRRLLTLAAAEPLGDPTLLWHAAERLGLSWDAASDAEAAGLIEFGAKVCFRHPLVRAAAYRVASSRERLDVHAALAAVTDPILDPDRRAWHRANSTVAQDDEIADELEHSAARAKSRGGLLAASALLERSALLTRDAAERADRTLAAARARRDAGALDAALRLLPGVEAEPASDLRSASAEHLRGQIAFDQRRGGDAARLLLSAARRFERFDARLARDTYLEALEAAILEGGSAGDANMAAAAETARMASPSGNAPRPVDLILDALAVRLTDGYVASAPMLVRALASVSTVYANADDLDHEVMMAGGPAAAVIANEVWDYDAGRTLLERQVRVARGAGALVQLQCGLNFLANRLVFEGELDDAAALVDEDEHLAHMTGVPPLGYAGLLLAAFRGDEERTTGLIATTADAAAVQGQSRIVTHADYAAAVLYNGLGHHARALECARRVFQRDVLGYQTLAAPELAEAASRCGEADALAEIGAWVSERARATPTDWALGMDARVRAFASEASVAESHYVDSIERLSKTSLRVESARSHLLYGEWLRRDGRRGEAREQLRIAFDMLASMGLAAFAERARRELLATGEKIRKRAERAAGSLTAQEMQIARLARQGLSNPEIGTRLFLSPRTVEWHLRNVFGKVGVASRRQLRDLDDAYLADAQLP